MISYEVMVLTPAFEVIRRYYTVWTQFGPLAAYKYKQCLKDKKLPF